MSVRKKNQRAARNGRTTSQKREAVMGFLIHPNLSLLSDREISRRTKTSQPFVSKLRRSVINQESTFAAAGLITRADDTGVGRAEAIFDALALNSFAWVTADPNDQRRFVDAAGLRALYEAASPDHRDAFLARLLAQLSPTDRPEHLPSNMEMYLDRVKGRAAGDGLDIPPQRRTKSEVA
jgi:hypothetical protein